MATKKTTSARTDREARRRENAQLDREIALALSRTGQLVARRQALKTVLREIGDVRGEGRIGDRKVFVAALYDRVGDDVGMTLPEFKEWLVERVRDRSLVMARADLVAAMPYEMVRRSEINVDGDRHVSLHFVVDPGVK